MSETTPTYVEPDSARATAYYVKALALLAFASVVSGLGVGLSVVTQNPVPVVIGGLVALGMLFMAGDSYFSGNRHMKWSTVEVDDDEDEE